MKNYTNKTAEKAILKIRESDGIPGNAISIASRLGIQCRAALFANTDILVSVEKYNDNPCIFINASIGPLLRQKAISRALASILLESLTCGKITVSEYVETHFQEGKFDTNSLYIQQVADVIMSS